MTIGELQKGVQDLWRFLYPPTLAIIITCAILRFVGGVRLPAVGQLLGTMPGSIANESAARAAAAYGFDAIAPIVLLFLLLLLVYLVRLIVLFIGDCVPGNILYRQHALYAHVLTPEVLEQHWARHPHAETLDQFSEIVDNDIHSHELKFGERAVRGVATWRAEKQRCMNLFRSLKFFLVLVPGALLIGAFAHDLPSNWLWRALFAVTFICTAAFVSLVRALQAIEQEAASEIMLWSSLQPSSNATSTTSLDKSARQLRLEALRADLKERWWRMKPYSLWNLQTIRRVLRGRTT